MIDIFINEKITHGRKLGTTEHVVKYNSEKIVAKCNHITTRQYVANLEGKDHSSFLREFSIFW